jgi:hypothetical protein
LSAHGVRDRRDERFLGKVSKEQAIELSERDTESLGSFHTDYPQRLVRLVRCGTKEHRAEVARADDGAMGNTAHVL